MNNLGILVIDMQENLFTEDKEKLVWAQIKLLNLAKREQIPVFTLEKEGCGKTIPELQGILKESKSYFISKKGDNGFENKGLAPLLERWRIKNLVLTGIYHYACVLKTSEGAKNAGLNIFICEDLMDRTYDFYTRLYRKETNYSSILKELMGKISKSAPSLEDLSNQNL